MNFRFGNKISFHFDYNACYIHSSLHTYMYERERQADGRKEGYEREGEGVYGYICLLRM
jgi:hypothetical protein